MEKGKKKEPGSIVQAVKAFSVLGGVGIYLVVVLGICIFIGNLIDESFGTGFTGKFIGILVGFPIAIYSIYRQIKNLY